MTQIHKGKRNLFIMWFANFFIAGSLTMVLPFLSLYIETFGNYSDQYVQKWSGLVFGITFAAAFIVSPIWGHLGDKYGRKKILIFSATGMGISVLLMSFATSVWQLFFLRLFMGVFTGFIPMSQAFISTQTPKKIAGKVLGTLQTGNVTGTLFGPLIGGLLADPFGFSNTFKITSITIFVSAILVLFTKEFRLKEKKEEKSSYTTKEVLKFISRHPLLINMLVISILIQLAHFSIQPILSLYVSDLHGPENLAFFAGIVFSATGLGNLLASRRIGKLGDRIGYIKILIALLFIAAIVYVPAAFVTNIWQLALIRFMIGVSLGGAIPLRIAYIRQEAPIAMQGEVMGYDTSLRFIGNILGPMLGGIVAGYYGIPAVFYMTSLFLLASGIMLYFANKRHSEGTAKNPVKEHAVKNIR